MIKFFQIGFLVFTLALTCYSQLAHSDIYKYKDKNGRWQFTDKPVNKDGTPIKSKQSNQKYTSTGTTTTKQSPKADLKKALFDRFKPSSKVDEATLSVVTVQTNTGSGSGFFITEDGFLITNRHVVRPSTTSNWKEKEAELKEIKIELADFKKALKEDEMELSNLKEQIDEDQEYIDTNKITKRDKKTHQRNIKQYKKSKQKHESNESRYRKEKREYDQQYSEFGFNSSMSNFSKKFTIVLKNGKKYKAKLVKVSKKHDLALLKLDHYTTPFLILTKGQNPKQGAEVFAIGSPLGVTDSLTSGIVAKSGKDHIYTDAQILPGNSGGPLINTEGSVLGVNTAKLSQEKNADGLGLAVYSKFIKQEFADKVPGKL